MYPTSQLPNPRRVQGVNPAVHGLRTEEPASPASLSRMSRRSKGSTQKHPPTFAPGSPARPGSGGGAEIATVTQPSRSACQRGAVTRRGGHDHKGPRRRAGVTFQGRGPLQRTPVTCCAVSRSPQVRQAAGYQHGPAQLHGPGTTRTAIMRCPAGGPDHQAAHRNWAGGRSLKTRPAGPADFLRDVRRPTAMRAHAE
jgi:hypothetical protein